MIVITVYDLSFRLLNNSTVEVKSDARGWDWGVRPAREYGLTDSHLGAIRKLIHNARGLFPDKAPASAKAEPLKPKERVNSMEPV